MEAGSVFGWIVVLILVAAVGVVGFRLYQEYGPEDAEDGKGDGEKKKKKKTTSTGDGAGGENPTAVQRYAYDGMFGGPAGGAFIRENR